MNNYNVRLHNHTAIYLSGKETSPSFLLAFPNLFRLCSISIFGKFNLYTVIKCNIYIEATDMLDMHYIATTIPEKSTRTYIQSIDRESSPYGLFHQKYRSTTDNARYGIWMSGMSYINVLRHHHDMFSTLARLPKWQPTLKRPMGYAVSLSY